MIEQPQEKLYREALLAIRNIVKKLEDDLLAMAAEDE